MPVLNNPRHERFAQELAKGKSQAEAYEAAGYSQNRGNATRLKANESVVKRVAELQARTAERAIVTAESLLKEAEEARVAAMAGGQISAAVSAIKEKGILAGVRVEKSERKSVNDIRRLSDDELDAAIADALARAESEERGSPVTH
jgi:phage terminase small subunit